MYYLCKRSTTEWLTNMTIIHLLLTGQPGGIEVLAQSIAQQSDNTNIMYFIFSGGSIADNMRASGIPVVLAETPRFVWKKKIVEFVQYCADNKVDVVVNHMYSPVACFYVYALKRQLPHIKILNYLHSDVRDIVKGIKGKILYRPLNRVMQRYCDKVIAISEFVKTAGIEAYGLPQEKIEVIYNAVDTNRFIPSGRIHAGDVMELIFVGRLIPEKGVHILLEALSLLPKEFPVHAIIVGYGTEFDHLQTLVDELGIREKIEFLGMRTDIPQLLELADFFVHPAICQEGFGITLVEAMACGKPCIASRGGAIPEIIDESNGFQFELGSASDLASKVVQAYQIWLTGNYLMMSEAARRKAEQFDIKKTVKELELLYQR